MPRHDEALGAATTTNPLAEAEATHDFSRLSSFLTRDRDSSTAAAAASTTPAAAATTPTGAATTGAAGTSAAAATSAAATSSAAASSGSNTGMIVGLAVGIPVLIAIVAGAAWFFLRKRKQASGPIGVGVYPRKGSGGNISKPSLPMSRSSSSSTVWGVGGAAAAGASAASAGASRRDLSDTEMQPLNGEADEGSYPHGRDPEDERHITDSFEPSRAPKAAATAYGDYYDDASNSYESANRVPDVADLAAANITRMHSYQRSTSQQRAAERNRLNSYAVSAMSAPQSAGDRAKDTFSPVSPVEDGAPHQLGLPASLVDQLQALPNQRFPSLGDGGSTFQAMLTDKKYGDSPNPADATRRSGTSFEELPLHMPAEEQKPPANNESDLQHNSVYELNRAPNTNRF